MIEVPNGGYADGVDGVSRSFPRGPLLDRRTFLVAGAAMLALPQPRSVALGQTLPGRLDIRYVVTDRRQPASVEFGRVLSAGGARRRDISTGLTAIWQESLLPLWRNGVGSVAGLTTRPVWECLVEQARSQALRPVLTGFHWVDPRSGEVSHRIVASPRLIATASTLDSDRGNWPVAMAALAGRCSSLEQGCAAEYRAGARAPDGTSSQSLVSWVIA